MGKEKRRRVVRLGPAIARFLPLAGLPASQRPARVLTGSAALVLTAAMVLAPLARAAVPAPAQFGAAAAGGAGLVVLVAALGGWLPGIGWSVALIATDYGLCLTGRPAIDPAAPIEAAGLLLVAELTVWSLECRTRAADRPGLLSWRLRRLALAEAVAVLSASAVWAAANLPAHGGTSLGAVGVASALAVLALAAAVLHRLRRPGAD